MRPRRKLPPIEGVPSTRPKCRGCDKPLTANYTSEFEGVRTIRRRFTGWHGYLGFHTKGCGLLFAHYAYNAGYRRTS